MKKILFLLLAACMLLSVASCSSKKEFARGTVKDGVYTQESFGFTFTAPDGYEFYSEEDIAKLYNTTVEELRANTSVIYDVQCGNPDTGSSLTVNYEELASIYGSVLSEDSYITLSLESLQSTFENIESISIIKAEKSKVSVAGTEYNGAEIVLDVSGATFYETIFIKEQGGYMMVCTAAAYNDTDIAGLLEAIELA